ncbi:MAG: hypothetical protein ABSD70_14800 [Terracidiphilus sp.]
MSKKLWSTCAGLFGLAALTLCAIPASAQMPEVKEKPPMYTYVANWQVPREHWPDIENSTSPAAAALQKALDDGTLIGYGSDTNLIHTIDGGTHDSWWSSMSMAGLIKALEKARAATDPHSVAFNSAKHWDNVYVSHYYNWKSGPYKGAYTSVSSYKLKADAPDDALKDLSGHLVAPLLEKLLADGTILEYEIDVQAVHTSAPGSFNIVYVTPTPEGIDTVDAAIRDTVKGHPLGIEAFGAATDYTAHRDEIDKSDGVYK